MDMKTREKGNVPDKLWDLLKERAKEEKVNKKKMVVCRDCGLPFLEAHGRDGLCPDCLWVEE